GGGKRKRAAGNPLSADGPDVLFLLPKVEDNRKVDHTFREGKLRRKIRRNGLPAALDSRPTGTAVMRRAIFALSALLVLSAPAPPCPGPRPPSAGGPAS